MIGIMVGLVSTLLILAMLVVVLIKIHARRHPQYDTNVNNRGAITRNNTLGMLSNIMSIVTIYGHKHFK